jgi:hypothetical protein
LPDDTEITSLDALALSAAVKARQLSRVEVMDAFLDRIELLNPRVNAIVSLQPRDLLRQHAQRAMRSWRGASRAVRSTVFQRQSRISRQPMVSAPHSGRRCSAILFRAPIQSSRSGSNARVRS